VVGVVPLVGLRVIQGPLLAARHPSAAPVLVTHTSSASRIQIRVDPGR
jgi:hypothetical protein